MMTLSDALATGRPFKHRDWCDYLTKENAELFGFVPNKDFFEPVWQVQEEEKPPMRVWLNTRGMLQLSNNVTDSNVKYGGETDITESLAKALAPYIKKELNL